MDQCIVACNHGAAADVGYNWPGVRLLWRSGPDGADLALRDVLLEENVVDRFDRVILGSGDGLFAETRRSSRARRRARHGRRKSVVSFPPSGTGGRRSRLLRRATAAGDACRAPSQGRVMADARRRGAVGSGRYPADRRDCGRWSVCGRELAEAASDFPKPKVQTPSGALFDLDEAEKWLIENGKIARRVSPFVRLQALTESARVMWRPEEVSRFSVACLVYFEACERAQSLGAPNGQPVPVVPAAASWTRVRQETRPSQFVKSLQMAAGEIEKRNPDLVSLIAPGFSHLREHDGPIARSIALAIDDATDDRTPRFDLLDDVISREYPAAETPRGRLSRHVLEELTEADRFSAELSTPEDLAYLMAQSAGSVGGTIFDPAAGECGLLLLTALWRSGDRQPRLVGVEVNETVWRIARSRCYLYEMPADLRLGNAFTTDLSELPKADTVVLDPPYSMSNWGSADVYLDERWRFGPPPPKNADFAWLQLAALQLKPNGRAAVLLPTGTLSVAAKRHRSDTRCLRLA